MFNKTDVQKKITAHGAQATIFHLPSLEKHGFGAIDRLPYTIKVLLENAVRHLDNYQVTADDIAQLTRWSPGPKGKSEIAFKPSRVILQDFTGVPCIVDLAAMRTALKRRGGDYRKINPQVPCDLIIDHSIQTDFFGSKTALAKNIAQEFKRNKERYAFLKWGQKAFDNLRVVPPATGIIHQVNLEYLATGVVTKKVGRDIFLYPDSVVGTDSHTTMINGLGVVGWGVGGIEAEAVMLGEPISMAVPDVIGVRLTGALAKPATATDAVLTITEMLRMRGVVGTFVEFFGDGLQALSLPDRATIANMAPEYGATMGFFPVDKETLRYYRMTGRRQRDVDTIERYLKEQGMFYAPATRPLYTRTVELNLASVEPSLAGPKRPHDRIPLRNMKEKFSDSLGAPATQFGFDIARDKRAVTAQLAGNAKAKLSHGSIAIASITSCTNTSNPSLLIGAGLLARNAVKKGLKIRKHVKTSLAPGSRVATEYLRKAGLLAYLEKLGFSVVGYGCLTCIGNSGPLVTGVAAAAKKKNLILASVLSGNRNFEGRINPNVKANYLASPLLVVAYALAGTVDIDLANEPLATTARGKKIFLSDIWPTPQEIKAIAGKYVNEKTFRDGYKNIFNGTPQWRRIKTVAGDLYRWNARSTYIHEPPFFTDMTKATGNIADITGARALVVVGDSITTDHISPAGVISTESPAGKYLQRCGVRPIDFNSYGSRRGDDRVMVRGTFANIRLRNLLAPGTEGSHTVHLPSKKKTDIYTAAMLYQKNATPLIVLAGKEYGTGSSRDWAAKGTALLGIQVVLAKSFERIHRSNLVGMGVLPLEFKAGDSRETIGLTGEEIFNFTGLHDGLKPRHEITVTATDPSGTQKTFTAIARLDTHVEIDYYRAGGILPAVLHALAA